MKQCEIIGTDETIVSTDTTLTGNGTIGNPLSVASIDPTMKETGFTSPANVAVTYDSTARTVTLSGTVMAYYQGTLVTDLVDGWVSDPHAAGPTAPLFLYYGSSGFTWSASPWAFSDLQIAVVVYTAAGDFLFCQREGHGFMDWRTHQELHETVGTYRRSGMVVAGVTTGSTTAADRRPTVSAGVVVDEDLDTDMAAHTGKADYSRMHFADASGTPTITAAADDIVQDTAGQIVWNEWTGATWQLANVTNNYFTSVWLVAVPASADATSQAARFLWMAGQGQSSSVTTERARTPAELDYGLLASLATEYVVIQQVILHQLGGNWHVEEMRRLVGSRASLSSNASSDFASTADAMIAAALAAEGLGTNAGKLERVDTGVWEAARRSNGVITAVADAGGGVCTITAAAHGQADGATVTISGTTDYNGDYVIANVTTDTFDITETFTSSQTGTFLSNNIYWVPKSERNGDWPASIRAKRRFYQGVTGTAATTLWASFPHVFLRAHGTVDGTPGVYPIHSYSVAGTLLRVAVEGTDLILRCGSDFDGASDPYFVTVDYYEP